MIFSSILSHLCCKKLPKIKILGTLQRNIWLNLIITLQIFLSDINAPKDTPKNSICCVLTPFVSINVHFPFPFIHQSHIWQVKLPTIPNWNLNGQRRTLWFLRSKIDHIIMMQLAKIQKNRFEIFLFDPIEHPACFFFNEEDNESVRFWHVKIIWVAKDTHSIEYW